MYQHGLHAPRNYQEAVSLFRLAANQGNAWGQFYLGSMYEFGLGVDHGSTLHTRS